MRRPPSCERTKSYGAEVVLYDRDKEDLGRGDRKGHRGRSAAATLVRPYGDDPFVIAGQEHRRPRDRRRHGGARRNARRSWWRCPLGGEQGLIAGVATAVKTRSSECAADRRRARRPSTITPARSAAGKREPYKPPRAAPSATRWMAPDPRRAGRLRSTASCCRTASRRAMPEVGASDGVSRSAN